MKQRWILMVPVLTLALVGMGADWDSSVRIEDGETHDRSISSLNGPIRIGDSARAGNCKSVNGSISIGMNSEVGSISAVNGQVEIGPGTRVDGGVSTVNGSIELDDDVLSAASGEERPLASLAATLSSRHPDAVVRWHAR